MTNKLVDLLKIALRRKLSDYQIEQSKIKRNQTGIILQERDSISDRGHSIVRHQHQRSYFGLGSERNTRSEYNTDGLLVRRVVEKHPHSFKSRFEEIKYNPPGSFFGRKRKRR